MTGDVYSGTKDGMNRTPDHAQTRRLSELEEKQAQDTLRRGEEARAVRSGGVKTDSRDELLRDPSRSR